MLHSFFVVPFLVVSLLHPVSAQSPNLQARDTTPNRLGGILNLLRRLVNAREIVTCNPDDIWTLMGSDWGKTACSELFSSPNATVTASVTLTSWTTHITATVQTTRYRNIKVTADATVTVTQTNPAVKKRQPFPAPEPTRPARLRRASNIAAAVQALQQWEAGNIDPSALLQWAPAVESACSCLDNGPLFTSTITEIVDTITITRNAYVFNYTNENRTVAIETSTSTVTVTEIPEVPEISASSSSALDPTITTGAIKFRFRCDNSDDIQEILAYPMLYTFKTFCGYAFQNEVAFNVTTLDTEDDCQAACAQANTNFGGPLCRGIAWDGTCKLYTDAFSGDLYARPGSNAAILISAYPLQSPSNFTATTGSPEQTSDALAPITGGNFTYQTPPASLVLPGNLSTITFSSCSGSTWTTGNVIRWTSSCSANASWYGDIIARNTAVYTTTLATSGQSGLAWSGGGEQSLTIQDSTIQTEVSGSEFATVVSDATSREWESGWASGGEVTITTVISDSTVIYVSTIPTPSSWSSEWSDGGELSLSDASALVPSATDIPTGSAWNSSSSEGGELATSDTTIEITVTTIISNSTIVDVSTVLAGSAWSSEWSDGGELTLTGSSSDIPSATDNPSDISWSIPTSGYNASAEETGDRFPLPTERVSSTESAADSISLFWSYSTAISIGGENRETFETGGNITIPTETASSLPNEVSLTQSLPIPEETASSLASNETSTDSSAVPEETASSLPSNETSTDSITFIIPSDTPSSSVGESPVETFTPVTNWNESSVPSDNTSTIQPLSETTEQISATTDLSSFAEESFSESSTPVTYWNESSTLPPSSVPTIEVPSNVTEVLSTISDLASSTVESASETFIPVTNWNESSSLPLSDVSTSQIPSNETEVPSTTSEITSETFTPVTNWNESSSLPPQNASTTQVPSNDTEVPSTTSEVSSASFTSIKYWNESSTIAPGNSSTAEPPLNATATASSTADLPFTISFEDRPLVSEEVSTTQAPESSASSFSAPYQNVSQVIFTVTVTESCPICSTTILFPSNDLFSPTFTLEEPTSEPTLSLSSSTLPIASNAPPPYLPRRPNTPATDDQIAEACRYYGNMLYNGGFELTFLASSVPVPQNYGWATNDAKAVQFLSTTEPDQLTNGGSWAVQFASSRASAVGTLWQPLTLCPGVEYVVGGYARQNGTGDGCEARFGISGAPVGKIVPGESWTGDVLNRTVYTVGPLAANASVNLEITMQCGGIADGKIGVMELDEISLTRVA